MSTIGCKNGADTYISTALAVFAINILAMLSVFFNNRQRLILISLKIASHIKWKNTTFMFIVSSRVIDSNLILSVLLMKRQISLEVLDILILLFRNFWIELLLEIILITFCLVSIYLSVNVLHIWLLFQTF